MTVVLSLRSLTTGATFVLGAFGAMAGMASPAAAETYDAQAGNIPAVSYPAIAESGGKAQDFVPQGWSVETEKTGDLN